MCLWQCGAGTKLSFYFDWTGPNFNAICVYAFLHTNRNLCPHDILSIFFSFLLFIHYLRVRSALIDVLNIICESVPLSLPKRQGSLQERASENHSLCPREECKSKYQIFLV